MEGRPHGDYLLLNGITYRLIHCNSAFQSKAWQIPLNLGYEEAGKLHLNILDGQSVGILFLTLDEEETASAHRS